MTKKMRLPGLLLVLALFLSSAVPKVTHAQKPAAAAVQDDADFAEFVKKATTKPEFLSPLVDHLPKKTGVPTPKDVLGYHIGTEKKLTYVADQQRYFRALEKALPGRVKTEVTGKTEEGRDIMVLFVTSEANLKNLEVNRQNTRKIADPRGLTDAQVQQLIANTKPHYHVSAGLHSQETNPPEAVIELAYRLAVSEEPYIKQIRDNVIVSITGATDVDGRDRYVDWYYAYKIDEQYDGGENYGDVPYWGKYVFHDNNRDINYGVDSLRVHLNWYLNWVPPIWHDLHEAQTLLYTFSGQPPQNANLDPILYTELPFFATYEVNKLDVCTACPACGTSASWTCGRPAISDLPPPITTACCGCTRSSTRAARTRRKRGSPAARRRGSGTRPIPLRPERSTGRSGIRSITPKRVC